MQSKVLLWGFCFYPKCVISLHLFINHIVYVFFCVMNENLKITSHEKDHFYAFYNVQVIAWKFIMQMKSKENNSTVFLYAGQLCGDGWHQVGEVCLRINSSRESYDNAQHYCKNLGGNIASLLTDKQVNFVLEELQKYQLQDKVGGCHAVNSEMTGMQTMSVTGIHYFLLVCLIKWLWLFMHHYTLVGEDINPSFRHVWNDNHKKE